MRNNTITSKALLLFFALTCTVFAKAQDPQDPCEITCNVEMPVCSESAVTLSVPNNYQYSFSWSPGGQTTSSITVRPFATTTYRIEIRDKEADTLICQNEFRVEVMPRFEVKFRQLKLTCSNHEEENGRDAQELAYVDSLTGVYFPPFNYQWEISPLHIAPGDPSWAIGLQAYKFYHIKVTDGRGCLQRDSVSPRAYPNPIIEITPDPDDTVYLQNPHVTYSFENLSIDTLPLSNFYWILNSQYNITSTAEEPRFTYVEVGTYSTELKVYNPQGCDTSYFQTVQVEPVKLKIPNVFTPNGDTYNDIFEPVVNGIDLIISAKTVIFNRWGNILWNTDDPLIQWDGKNKLTRMDCYEIMSKPVYFWRAFGMRMPSGV